MLSSFTWHHPTRVRFGAGELAALPQVLDGAAGPGVPVFLVTGRRSVAARGTLDRVRHALGTARVSVFDQCPPFPPPAVVDRAAAACREAGAGAVVAIGGGSAMDVAKLVAVLAAHGGSARELADRHATLVRPGLPLVACPTTSGSSSEVTPFATMWDMEAKRSLPVASPFLFPAVALVDPELAASMPRDLAAVTGADALTSAVEAYWSREASPLSDLLCLEVVRLMAEHLERSCATADPAARAACALAATLSGIAYTNSRPNVCHAVGSPLTLYWGVSHGQAVGVSLPAFLRWNAPAIAPKLPALWSALGVRDLDEAEARLHRLLESCGLQTRLGALGVSAPGVETLVEHLRWERVAVLPRPFGREDARELLHRLL